MTYDLVNKTETKTDKTWEMKGKYGDLDDKKVAEEFKKQGLDARV